jgi:hypothetical protein
LGVNKNITKLNNVILDEGVVATWVSGKREGGKPEMVLT